MFSLLLVGIGLRAEARTYKVDVAPSLCVEKRGTVTVNYYTETPPDFLFIQAKPNGFADMVCPVPIGEVASINGFVQMSFDVRYDAENAAGGGANDFRCMAFWEFNGGSPASGTKGVVNPDFTSGNSTYQKPNGAPMGSGVLKGVQALVQIPVQSLSQFPYQLTMHCYMTGNSRIREIQITMSDN